jgi:hypothetical protein
MVQRLEDEHLPTLVVGARGWEHPAWQGIYYPEDLPAQWRLAYYANDFRGVLVPASHWTGMRAQDWQDWAEDATAPFRFYLELPSKAPERARATERLGACREALGDKLAAVLVSDRANPHSLGTQPHDCRALEPLSEKGRGTAHWALDPAPSQAGRLEVALIGPAGLSNLRGLRTLIEALVGSPTPRPKALLLTGSPPDPEDLDRLKTLVRLMGLA